MFCLQIFLPCSFSSPLTPQPLTLLTVIARLIFLNQGHCFLLRNRPWLSMEDYKMPTSFIWKFCCDNLSLGKFPDLIFRIPWQLSKCAMITQILATPNVGIILYTPCPLNSGSQTKTSQPDFGKMLSGRWILPLAPVFFLTRVKRLLFLSVTYKIINGWKLRESLCYKGSFKEILIHPSNTWLLKWWHLFHHFMIMIMTKAPCF